MSENYIQEIHLRNFKSFREKRLASLKKGINILIGDNDTGKSSILLAIELVLSCNTNRVESIGLDKLLNRHAVEEFLDRENREVTDLPTLEIDIYLNELGRAEYEGEQNIDHRNTCGIHLRCIPNVELLEEIEEVIRQTAPAFPYEYYCVEIATFAGMPLSPYKKTVSSLSIDNTKISNDYATKAHIHSVYRSHTSPVEQNQLKYKYRDAKKSFSHAEFADVNERMEQGYSFTLKSDSKANLETDLGIERDGIDLDSWGVGSQCFIRAKFALSTMAAVDVVCLEEPENHLSQHNMRKLIDEICAASQSQVFVTTHSSLITSRLDLRNALLFGDKDQDPISLADLEEETAEYFMRAPTSSVLEYAMSSRVVLVEGDAEFVLFPALYERATNSTLENDRVNVISVGGLSAPRFLAIGNFLNIKTAVLTDNDKNVEKCNERYQDHLSVNVALFTDNDESRHTFEVCLYQDNEAICENAFGEGRRTLSVQEFMLKNKSKVAYELAREHATDINVPEYIMASAQWIKN